MKWTSLLEPGFRGFEVGWKENEKANKPHTSAVRIRSIPQRDHRSIITPFYNIFISRRNEFKNVIHFWIGLIAIAGFQPRSRWSGEKTLRIWSPRWLLLWSIRSPRCPNEYVIIIPWSDIVTESYNKKIIEIIPFLFLSELIIIPTRSNLSLSSSGFLCVVLPLYISFLKILPLSMVH